MELLLCNDKKPRKVYVFFNTFKAKKMLKKFVNAIIFTLLIMLKFIICFCFHHYPLNFITIVENSKLPIGNYFFAVLFDEVLCSV